MKTNHSLGTLSLLVAGLSLASCSGASSLLDGGGNDAATTSDSSTTDGPTLFGLTKGDSCFDVVSIEPGFTDGCNLGVGDPASGGGPVGAAFLVNYDMTLSKVTVGTAGSLGTGIVTNNMGTLLRDGDTSDTTMTTCTWHQKDTSTLTMTATNEFTLAVTEVESMFAAAPACTASTIPAGGTCTSTWTWKMKRNASKTPPCK